VVRRRVPVLGADVAPRLDQRNARTERHGHVDQRRVRSKQRIARRAPWSLFREQLLERPHARDDIGERRDLGVGGAAQLGDVGEQLGRLRRHVADRALEHARRLGEARRCDGPQRNEQPPLDVAQAILNRRGVAHAGDGTRTA